MEPSATAEHRWIGATQRFATAHPSRTFAEGRVCAAEGCTTRLSIYNPWRFCWQHEPVHDYVSRGERTSHPRRKRVPRHQRLSGSRGSRER